MGILVHQKSRPLSKYLVTGLPRTRSAWLAAVLSTPELPCVHSRDDTTFPVDYAHGLSDPCAASIWPDRAAKEFCGKPIVVIERDVDQSRDSFVAMMIDHGRGPLDPDAWERLVRNYEAFRSWATLKVPYEDLEDSETVLAIAEHLGLRLTLPYIAHMQLLNIQQDITKCQG